MDPSLNNVSNVTLIAGTKYPVLLMDTFLVSGHIICALFGIPLNVMIIVLIIVRRRLRQPRNIIWLGIGFSNIFGLFAILLEVILFYSKNDDTDELCRFRFFFNGFPYVSHLMQNFLSLVDRYLSNFHSVWYRRCVTVRWVLGIQLGAFVLLFFLMKPHYIFGIIQVKCNFFLPLDKVINFGFIFFFIILCLFGQLTVYIMIKQYLVMPSTNKKEMTNGGYITTTTTHPAAAATRGIHQGYPTSAPPTDNNEVAVRASEDVGELNDSITIEHNDHHLTAGPTIVHLPTVDKEEMISPEEAIRALQVESNDISASFKQNNHHFVKIRDQIVSRLELEATRNVIASVGLLLLFTLPWIISSVLGLICQRNIIQQAMNEDKTAEALVEQCNRYRWASTYTRLLLIAHCIYQSFSFLKRSKDVSAALRRTS